MKLRLVKFLTSRENEIEKKEEEGRSPIITCSTTSQPGRSQTPLPLPLLFSPPFIISALLSPTQPTSLLPPPPQLVGRHVSRNCRSSYPSPAVLLLPSFFISNRAQQLSRGAVPSLLAQLAGPAVAAPSSPAGPCPPGTTLVLHRLRFLPSLSAVHPHRAKPQENKDRK